MRAIKFASALILLVVACSGGGNAEQAASDRMKARDGWKLTLDDGGVAHEIPVDRMDIYLVDDESYPEIFEIYGDGLMLVGEFPRDLHVGYEEAFERLVGREIKIRTRGGFPDESKTSKVTLDGIGTPVSAGTFRIERVSGKWSGDDGDRTLHGTIELRVHDSDGERVLRGRFGAHAVTWG